MASVAEAIGLSTDWPDLSVQHDDVNVAGALLWAAAYFDAAEKLNFELWKERGSPHYMGPVIQVVGLSAELTLKALLRGCGKQERQLRGYSHDTYRAYCDARACFDELKFINLHISNTQHLTVPPEVGERLAAKGEEDVEGSWRCFFKHLRLLDGLYDRPYRSRYVTPGPVHLPDTELVLTGLKILLSAMHERVED